MAVASTGPHASLHLAPDRQPRQHPTTRFLQAGCPSCRPTNSVKALKAQRPHNAFIFCTFVIVDRTQPIQLNPWVNPTHGQLWALVAAVSNPCCPLASQTEYTPTCIDLLGRPCRYRLWWYSSDQRHSASSCAVIRAP